MTADNIPQEATATTGNDCQHEQRVFIGTYAAPTTQRGIIRVTWVFKCDVCQHQWTESADYMTERFYGIENE